MIRGPGGAIWGANAVNGVINIIMKDAAASRGDFVTVSAGSDEHVLAGARHGGRLGVSVDLRRDGDTDELTVSDTGIGIASAFLPSVFETFRQADASSTRAHGGLGLGLSIVRHLVEMHGGEVRVESEGLNQGARFVVRLPLRAAARAPEPPAASAGVPAALGGILTGVRVVVVDDDDGARELLQSVFESAGANVRTAASAEEAFNACAEDRPDALVSDIAMPGQDGYGLMRQIEAALGADKPRVTIALSAFAGQRDRQRSADAGFDRHVAKPFDPESLVRLTRELLEGGGAAQPTPAAT